MRLDRADGGFQSICEVVSLLQPFGDFVFDCLPILRSGSALMNHLLNIKVWHCRLRSGNTLPERRKARDPQRNPYSRPRTLA